MEKLTETKCDVNMLSPLNLAFIGDTVFDLFVRERLVCEANRPVSKLHNKAASMVKASAQAEAVEKIRDRLTEQEQSIIRRGRNAHVNHKAKNMSEADYHLATGLEALIGYLYLKGETERLNEIFGMIIQEEKE
ncbi:MAG: ribonuclease III [Ruminococcaceae bacterium]|nr:ribonuclease III [Oscillospiraceae bacterium]